MKQSRVHKVLTLTAVALASASAFVAGAANIGFVAGLNGGNLDKQFDLSWAARLTLQGHTVTAIDQTTAANSPSLVGLDLFIVSSDVGSGTFLTGVGINQSKPILTYEYGLYDDIFGATGVAGATYSGITISNPSHPLAAGLSGSLSIYTGAGTISKYDIGSAAVGTEVVAVGTGDANQSIFAVLPAGTPGAAGTIWPALRMAVPAYDTWDPTLVTADGWKLLDGAVTFGLSPVPEPGSLTLLGLGMALFLARRQRQ